MPMSMLMLSVVICNDVASITISVSVLVVVVISAVV